LLFGVLRGADISFWRSLYDGMNFNSACEMKLSRKREREV